MKLVIDVFGGDNAPSAIIGGIKTALETYDDIELLLTGDEARIKDELHAQGVSADRIEIIHAPEIIDPSEKPVTAIKKKKDSSIVAGLRLVKEKRGDVFISAGSTGAVLAGATLITGRLKGVKRPALCPLLPTAKGSSVMLIDCGANVDCKPEYLQQFAVMGSAYMEKVIGVKTPRVGLINNGAEAEKGNELTKAAYPLLAAAPINFAGNCEGREILSGDFDVAVADGFVGNAVLKHTEGMASAMFSMLKTEMQADLRSKLGAALLMPALKRFKKRMDYTEYGGALLLGIDGGIIKAHGSSNAKAIFSAIRQGREFARGNVLQTIREGIAQLEETAPPAGE